MRVSTQLLCLLVLICSLGSAPHTDVPVIGLKLVPVKASGSITYLGPQGVCDGKHAAFVDSGVSSAVLALPSEVPVGTTCKIAIAIGVDVVVLPTGVGENIMDVDGITECQYLAAGHEYSIGAFVSLTTFDDPGGASMWTVDDIYGTWLCTVP